MLAITIMMLPIITLTQISLLAQIYGQEDATKVLADTGDVRDDIQNENRSEAITIWENHLSAHCGDQGMGLRAYA